MCGRYSRSGELALYAARFGCAPPVDLNLPPRYNQAPGQDAAVVIAPDDDQGRRLAALRWGLVPHWAKDAAVGYKTINARVEGLAAKPAFRGPLKTRRCLVAADGFYEWRRAGKAREPLRFVRHDRAPFAMAGLWDVWADPAGGELRSFAIITVPANPLVATVHERMPALLTPEREAAWLDPAQHDPAELLPLLAPYPAELMEAYPVSPAVNRVNREGPELIEPYQSEPADEDLFSRPSGPGKP